jgi:hypothetical protein
LYHRTGGIALAAKISEKIEFNFYDTKSSRQLVHPEILRIMYGLFVQGRSSFEEIKLFRFDPFFKQAFDLKYVPAAETLRLYLEKITEAKDGTKLLFPEIEVETFWTNLYETPEEVIELYHAHIWWIKLWDHDPWLQVFSKLYESFCTL